MSNFDQSRLEDLRGIEDKLHSYITTRVGKRRLERSRAAILRQDRDPYVKNMRRRLLMATQAQDIKAVADINDQLQRYDNKHGYDQDNKEKLKPGRKAS